MPLKQLIQPVLIAIAVAMPMAPEVHAAAVSIELSVRAPSDPLDAELVASLINDNAEAIEVVLPSGEFPFEVELLDKSGIDLLSKDRRPVPTHRTGGPVTQVVRLAAGQRRAFTKILRAYLTERQLSAAIADAAQIRVFVAASTSGLDTFAVLRSDSVPIPKAK